MTKTAPTTAPKSPTAPEAVLTADQKAAVDALEYDLPDYKALSNGEIGALGAEALEGYFYGERTRYDTGGKKWVFAREHVENAFRLTIRCSVGDVVLAEAGMPLDRLASKAGEEQIIRVVEHLAGEATVAAKAATAYQRGRR